jgi:2-keto-4-pentenoate hydratase/2-oxohepta-3-ene-1,7-dioic acid hydratase in catechol pathway
MSEVGHPQSGRIWLKVNDEIRQDVDLKQLVCRFPNRLLISPGSISCSLAI